MHIQAENIGRRFGRDWIFRGVNIELPEHSHSLFVGPNGSGKSTLLAIVSGFMEPSEGSIIASENGKTLEHIELAQRVSIATPYMDLYEDLTLEETIAFQATFRPFLKPWSTREIMDIAELSQHANKRLSHFSSGMRQRVRLVLALLTSSQVVFLDEPTSNLDQNAIAWYHQLLALYGDKRTVVVSTNSNADDYIRADQVISISDYK